MSTLELGTLQAELGALAAAGEQIGNYTLVTVTGTFSTQNTPGAAGQVTFTLTRPLSNGGLVVPASPVTVTLDANGSFSVVLVATDDPGTGPQGVWYGVTEQITNAQPSDYFITVSATGPNPLQLSPPATLPWL